MKTLNNSITDNSLELIRSLLDEKLISYSHESFDSSLNPSNDFFMRLGLVCSNGCFVLDNRVDWEDDWFSSPDYTPHIVFNRIDNENQFTTYAGFTLSEFDNYPVNERIVNIILVQDEILVLKDNKPYEIILSTEGVIIETEKKQYAFYKENTWLDETVLEYKGHDVLSKLEDIKTHWNVFAKPFDGEITRKLLYLKNNEEKIISQAKIIGNVYDE